MNSPKIKKRYILLFLIAALFILINKPAKEYNFPMYHGKSITYILIDGFEKRTFEKLLNNNQIPNISKLKKEGIFVENGIGSFPSMTGYAFYPFLTGIDAVKSGVIGLRWLDKSRESGQFRNYVGRTNIHMNKDLDEQYPTLFELKDSFYTASVNSYMTKGVHDERKTGWAMTTSKYQDQKLVRFLKSIPYFGKNWTYSHYQHESFVAQNATEQLLKNPAVQWITFASPDAYAHINGMDEEYENIIIHIDGLIGQLLEESKKQNQERYFAVITDHGLEDVTKNICIEEEVKKDLGITLKRGDSTNLLFSDLDDDISKEDIDGYFVINGNLLSFVYLKATDKKWSKILYENDLRNYGTNSSYDLITYFAKNINVEMVMYKIDKQTIGVADKNGFATITKKNKLYKYSSVESDPFNYATEDSLLIDTFYSKNKWLELTCETNYPDAVFRSFELVNSPKSGDLVLLSAPKIDFAKDYEILVGNYKGGHGGLRSSMLNVSYILTGPEIKPKTIKTARAEDIGTTVFKYLDIDQATQGTSL